MDLWSCTNYCVFACAGSWYAVPAPSVREVLVRPVIAPVPGCSTVSAGVCHVRNEFLPVLNLAAVLGTEGCGLPAEQLVVFNRAEGAWSLLVERVIGLESLEVALTAEPQQEGGWSAAMIGSATLGDEVVRVLDPERLYRWSGRLLREYWDEHAPVPT